MNECMYICSSTCHLIGLGDLGLTRHAYTYVYMYIHVYVYAYICICMDKHTQ